MIHPAATWSSAKAARRQIKSDLSAASKDSSGAEEALAVLKLRSMLRLAYFKHEHSDLATRLAAVSAAIVDFSTCTNTSMAKTKQWCKMLGMCLVDGNFYFGKLRTVLKNKAMRVPLDTVKKEDRAKLCLIVCF